MFWPKKQYRSSVSLCLPLLLCLLHNTQNASTFIVPSQLPTLLSLVFSNIPPIKKGTDSRLGFGFRLGDNADFQMLVELGPQKETRPIGDPSKDDQSFNKRQVSADDKRALLRQQFRQQLQQEAEMLMTSTERNAATWLESWSNGMKPQKTKTKSVKVNPQPSLQGQPTSIEQLQLLYKLATTSTSSSTTTSTTPAPSPDPAFGLKLGGSSGFKLPPPALLQDTNTLSQGSGTAKSRAEITKELMDVSLETES
ncbi:uncharacterized protein Dwil_GK24591 [Drosophila willistoni]|uniref:Uncharacterized protein n=1 Tax=Drosophila willistoni TaxID=7260 RepID=B4N0J1_DROWI|nr:uncharacterized protein LOC6644008 [Drosophila willistoni]EDW77604.1 uncharacterized protein Dwil_GK24591 [Drosophila willistoni]